MNEFAPATGINWNPGGLSGTVKYGDDRNLLVMFYNRSVEVPSESAEKGRRICRDEIYVTIQHPGESLNKIDRPATDQDKHRFRDSWSKFLQNRTQIPEGTPIDLLFPNHPSVAENLRAYGVYTIEQCAGLSAHAIDSIGRGGQEYVNRSKRYLDSATKGAGFHALQKELDETKQALRLAENQISQFKVQLDSLLMRNNDPIRGAISPPFVQNYDVQAERINANHPTQEVFTKTKNTRRGKVTVEDRITDPLASSPMQNDPNISMTEGQDA